MCKLEGTFSPDKLHITLVISNGTQLVRLIPVIIIKANQLHVLDNIDKNMKAIKGVANNKGFHSCEHLQFCYLF